jgi:type IX secretion system substrate protein
MKSLTTLIVSILLFMCEANAQHDNEWYNNGDSVYIQPGSLLCIQGDMYNNGFARPAWLINNGFIEVQGNLYSNTLFQQRGVGTLRMNNRQVNLNERQFIQGSYAVRGGQAKIGVDDGSFYNLELNNSTGYVHLTGYGNVADVRNSVNFKGGAKWVDNNLMNAGPALNTLVTHDIGATGTINYPANGFNYFCTFGLMNPNAGMDNLINSTVSLNGTLSHVDSGYVVGRFRRAIDPAGGTKYGFILGLEPSASTSAARGLQYFYIDFKPNKFDYITGFFQQASSNYISGNIVYCTGTVINFYGNPFGEWMLYSAGTSTADYNMVIFPQDFSAASSVSYFITRNNSFAGNANDCATSAEGLSRGGYYSFGEFGFAGSSFAVPLKTLMFSGKAENCDVLLTWSHQASEKAQSFEIEMADVNSGFQKIATIKGGNITNKYSYVIKNASSNGFYRLKIIDPDLQEHYSSVENIHVKCDGPSNMRVLPNPVTGNQVQLKFENFIKDNYIIEVYSSNGAMVLQKKIVLTNSNQQIYLDGLERLSKGTYWIKLSNSSYQLIATDKLLRQ